MKRVIVFLLILLMAGGGFMLWWKQKTNGMIYPESSEESAVLKAFETMQQAMIDKDIDTLNDLVTVDKTFTHMSGKVQTKEQFFGEIEDGTLNYYSYKLNSPVVTVDGDTALLTGSTTLEAKVYGASGTWTLKTNQHFVKQDGKWLLTDK